jgi:thiamine biosynthesis protein ThiS
MTLTINGKHCEFPLATLPVPRLLESLGIDYPVLVELNGSALFQREWLSHEVKDGDRIELFRMVAGG